MYSINNQLVFAPRISTEISYPDVRSSEINRALHLFNTISNHGWVSRLLGKLIHRVSQLLDLNQCADGLRLRGQYYAGIQPVSIDQIRGTRGKSTDFDAVFTPLNERTRSRWLNIAIARMQKKPLPPVELIQVGETYFVVDGHHRISVARALGEQMIDAEVTIWNVIGPLPWEKSLSPACLNSQPA